MIHCDVPLSDEVGTLRGPNTYILLPGAAAERKGVSIKLNDLSHSLPPPSLLVAFFFCLPFQCGSSIAIFFLSMSVIATLLLCRVSVCASSIIDPFGAS